MATSNIRLPTTGDSSSSSQHKTIEISNLGKIKKITVDTGNVTYELLDNNQVKINVSGGSYTRKSYSSRKYSKYVTGQTSSKYNSGGYSGTLTSYLYSGNYIPAKSKKVTNQTSPNYNSGGYSGTLTGHVISGSYTPAETKNGTYRPSGHSDCVTVTSRISASDARNKAESALDKRTHYYNENGYKGYLHIGSSSFEDVEFHDGVYTQFAYINMYYGKVTKPAVDTRVYRYDGTVTKPAVDTRVYRYKGTVYKGGYYYYYAYNVAVEYEEDSQTYLKINGKYKKVHFQIKIKGSYKKAKPYFKKNKKYKNKGEKL